jgi:hypothetical protein
MTIFILDSAQGRVVWRRVFYLHRVTAELFAALSDAVLGLETVQK